MITSCSLDARVLHTNSESEMHRTTFLTDVTLNDPQLAHPSLLERTSPANEKYVGNVSQTHRAVAKLPRLPPSQHPSKSHVRFVRPP